MALLTDTRARKLKPTDKPVADGSVPGLSVHPSATVGRSKWILRFKSPLTGKRRDMGLGSYPEVPIAAARKKAFEAREIIVSGSDPLELRRAEEQALAPVVVPTFEKAARLVFDEIKGSIQKCQAC